MSIQYVLGLFMFRSNFSADFQYWEKHKTDVWSFFNDDSISEDGGKNTYSADKNFRSINDFVNSAKEFCRLIDRLQKDLENYVTKYPDASLQYFINSNNGNLLINGKQRMDNITLYINRLPSKLLINKWIDVQSEIRK